MKKIYFFSAIILFYSMQAKAAVQEPVLKWKEAGCYSTWCDTGWYSSPAVADLDGNGAMEIIGAAETIVALRGATGELLWRVASGKDRNGSLDDSHRTWPGIWIADVDGDDIPEIITAHKGGHVSVYNNEGYFKPGWPKKPTSSELRGLVVHDIDRDGTAEIIVTATTSDTNTWVYEHDGLIRPGWSQNDSYGAAGVYNDNSWVEDLDGDGQAEILVPSDVTRICVYKPDGFHLDTNPIYGDKKWGEVSTWESLETEIRGWGEPGTCIGVRSEDYKCNLALGAAVVTDVDGDGLKEVVVTGNMYDCRYSHPPGKYTALFIFNADRSRFKTGAWNWEETPVDTGAPLSEDWEVIENCMPNPVVVDLDNDKQKEILFPSYDGRMHAFWLDKTERHDWPYSIYNNSEGFFRFASEPVVADLDRDGCSEVIFTSWVEKTSSGTRLGKLHILDCQGKVIHEQNLPAPKSTSRHVNGALPAPTIANIDEDADYELVINTINSGFIAYDLPGSAGARIQWQSGRNRGSIVKKQIILTPMLQLLLRE